MTELSKGKILVTGGAGFIGSALVWALNRRGLKNILVADLLAESEKWKNLAALQFSDYVEADDLLGRIENAPHLFSDIKVILHLGACSNTTESNAAYLIRNNFEYTKALAHFALEGGRRFVYASSAATYGALEASVSEAIPLQTLRPLNMYGYSKHLFDCYAERAGMLPRITGVKYFNVFGPNEDHKAEMRSMVHKAFHQIRERGRLALFKSYRAEFPDGGQRRDFLYVKDAVGATLFLTEHTDGEGLFNIGSGQAHTWLDLADAIFAACGRPKQIDFIDMPEEIRNQYQYYTCANIEKLRSAGFTQELTPLTEAVRDCIQTYLMRGIRLGDEQPVY